MGMHDEEGSGSLLDTLSSFPSIEEVHLTAATCAQIVSSDLRKAAQMPLRERAGAMQLSLRNPVQTSKSLQGSLKPFPTTLGTPARR
jgi:hypothetical protein